MLASPQGARHAFATAYDIPRVGAGMSDTHQNQPEGTKPKHPICPTCDVPMWLVEHRPAGPTDASPRQVFECKVCGSRVVLPPVTD